jgi:hypothetical protein
LREVYLIWWVLGLLVSGLATALLAAAWTPRQPVVGSLAVTTLIGLGPLVVLGSTTPALATALPHERGGFLGYLTLVLLLTRRPRAAAVALVACTAVHVQIGAIAAVVTLLVVLVTAALERRWWWSALIAVGISAALVLLVLTLRPVASDGQDFVQICDEVIPYHCDATSWPVGQLLSGFAVVLAALLSALFALPDGGPDRSPDQEDDQNQEVDQKADLARWAAAVLVPAVGLVGGVLADRYQVPVLGRLAQQTNIFRLAVLLVPFGAWGLIAGFQRLPAFARAGAALLAAAAGYGWLAVPEGAPALPGDWLPVLGVVGVALLGTLLVPVHRPTGVLLGLAALVLALAGAVQLGTFRARSVNITFVPDRQQRDFGAEVDAHVPVGSVLVAPPWLGVIRLTSGRSMVVDCKAVPYGGPAWTEYRARLDQLGGRAACGDQGRTWLKVPAADLVATAHRYRADYLVLTEGDPRLEQLLLSGWRVMISQD